jgi:hypothetical protein
MRAGLATVGFSMVSPETPTFRSHGTTKLSSLEVPGPQHLPMVLLGREDPEVGGEQYRVSGLRSRAGMTAVIPTSSARPL